MSFNRSCTDSPVLSSAIHFNLKSFSLTLVPKWRCNSCTSSFIVLGRPESQRTVPTKPMLFFSRIIGPLHSNDNIRSCFKSVQKCLSVPIRVKWQKSWSDFISSLSTSGCQTSWSFQLMALDAVDVWTHDTSGDTFVKMGVKCASLSLVIFSLVMLPLFFLSVYSFYKKWVILVSNNLSRH